MSKAISYVLPILVLACPAFGQEGTPTLTSGQRLNEGQRLVSPNKAYYLVMQADGNLCIYTRANVFVWASMVTKGKGSYLILQDDGNLVVHDAADAAVWSTQTQAFFDAKYGTPEWKPVRAALSDDGTLGLFTAANKQVWISSEPKVEGFSGPTTKQELNIVLPFAKAQKLPVEVTNDGKVIFEKDMVLGNVSDPPSNTFDPKYWIWPSSTIPYVIKAGHGKKDLILEGINEINSKTNLYLVPRTNEKDYVEFVSLNGHWSALGRVWKGGRQEISIDQTNSSVPMGTVAHEIMHAAGFNHTQSREDRDKYVTINFGNIKIGKEGNFTRLEDKASNIGAYDFGSLMHYSAGAFSQNSQNTIALKGDGDISMMGQRKAVSAGDIAAIATIYAPAPGKPTNAKLPSTKPDPSPKPTAPNPNLPNTSEFDSNKYYRLTSLFIGKGKSLDVENNIEGNTVHLANSETNLEGTMGQYWKIEKDRGGVYYNIKPYFRGLTGQDITLDIVNDSDKNKLTLSKTGGFAGQAWKIEKLSNGCYRLTTAFFGEGRSLDVVNDGKERNVQLAPTGEFTGQAWMITEIPIPAEPTTPNPNLPNTPTGAALTAGQQLAEKFRTMALYDSPIDADNPNYVLINEAVYFVTNEARVKEGKSLVAYHPLLAKAAFDYAREMVTKDFFSHDHPSDPAQRTPTDRGKLAGIKNASLAENIAINFGIQYEAGKNVFTMDATKGIFSYVSPEGPALPMHTYRSLAKALVDQWMNSPGHRANILSDNNRSFGCGVYFFRDRDFSNMLKVKAVQVFQWFKDVEE